MASGSRYAASRHISTVCPLPRKFLLRERWRKAFRTVLSSRPCSRWPSQADLRTQQPASGRTQWGPAPGPNLESGRRRDPTNRKSWRAEIAETLGIIMLKSAYRTIPLMSCWRDSEKETNRAIPSTLKNPRNQRWAGCKRKGNPEESWGVCVGGLDLDLVVWIVFILHKRSDV